MSRDQMCTQNDFPFFIELCAMGRGAERTRDASCALLTTSLALQSETPHVFLFCAPPLFVGFREYLTEGQWPSCRGTRIPHVLLGGRHFKKTIIVLLLRIMKETNRDSHCDKGDKKCRKIGTPPCFHRILVFMT